MVRVMVGAAGIVLSTWGAQAQTLPRYDVEEYCQELSAYGGGSPSTYNTCIEMEQDAYDDLKSVWIDTPRRIRDYCDQLARYGGESYSTLNTCVDMETEAASSPRSFRY